MRGIINSTTNLYYTQNYDFCECKIRITTKSTSKEIIDNILENMYSFLEVLSPEDMGHLKLLECLKIAKYSNWQFRRTIKTVFPIENKYFNGPISMWIHFHKPEDIINVQISMPKKKCGDYRVSNKTQLPKELSYSARKTSDYIFLQDLVKQIEEEYTKL